MSLESELLAAKQQALSQSIPDLQNRLMQAENEIESFSKDLPYPAYSSPEEYRQQIATYRAERYAMHIHSFLMARLPDQAAAEANVIRGYLIRNSNVPNNAGLVAPSGGGPVVGAYCGSILYTP